MNFIKKHLLLFLFILGLLVRFSLLFLDYSWDVNNHLAWAKDLFQRGFQNFYETPSSESYASLYPNYPPLAMYLFYFVYSLQPFIYKLLWWINITIPFFPSKLMFFIKERAFLAGTFKLPAVAADLGLAWIGYLFAKKIAPKNREIHLLTVSLILFNPAFFYNSAYWGQIDAIPLFFALWSFYLLLFSRRYLASGIFFILALLAKPTVLVFLPLYIIFFIWKFKLKKFIGAFIVAQLIFWLLFLPFLGKGNGFLSSYIIYYKKIFAAQSLPFVTNGAFNFWVLITHFKGIKDTAFFVFGLSYKIWAYFIVGIFYVLIIHRSWKLKDKTQAFLSAGFFAAFASFLFLTKMHERYLILPLPFLLLAGVGDKRFLKWFFVISLLSFLNLYHSWPVPYLGLIKTILSNPLINTSISLFNVLLFFYLFKRYIHYQ